MTTINDFIDSAMEGSTSQMQDQFATLARDLINSKIDALRPAVHSSIFNAPVVAPSVTEAAEDKNSDFHIKFKDKSNGQWFQSKKFKSQNEMTQHFWTKIKPVAGEVQFHGPKGRLAESVNAFETTLEELTQTITEEYAKKPVFITPGSKSPGRVFNDPAAASEFLRNNPTYGVVNTKDGKTRVAKIK